MIHAARAALRISQRPFARVAFRQRRGKTNSTELIGARAKSFLMTARALPRKDWRSPGYDIMQLSRRLDA
jgi:hypothetical protein